MTTLDFSPLYRSSVGFDRIANVLNSLSQHDQNQVSYPPYNIELTGDNQYRITMAVAGFSDSELAIEAKESVLTVSGKKEKANSQPQYLHHGIAARNFERRFQLADYVRVQGAQIENGLLHIALLREIPEAMKPRSIPIQNAAAGRLKVAEAS